jgi:hypothetical protein
MTECKPKLATQMINVHQEWLLLHMEIFRRGVWYDVRRFVASWESSRRSYRLMHSPKKKQGEHSS